MLEIGRERVDHIINSNRELNRIKSSLIHSDKSFLLYRLLESFEISLPVISTYRKAGLKEYLAYHDEEYLNVLLNEEFIDSDNDQVNDILEEFGLVDDCFLFTGIKEYLSIMTGATLFAVHLISTNQTRVAIHWEGGRFFFNI